jgi:hypothetical protein
MGYDFGLQVLNKKCEAEDIIDMPAYPEVIVAGTGDPFVEATRG